ncbi:hypothetical protein [Staphylococcus aureus]|uniref:hypothetical protein n=1 Tax=Staphylococcus aureus TaxID=1280 RepID=UPI0030F4A645
MDIFKQLALIKQQNGREDIQKLDLDDIEDGGGNIMKNFEFVLSILLFYSIHRGVDLSSRIRELEECGLLDYLDSTRHAFSTEDDRNICDYIDMFLERKGIKL